MAVIREPHSFLESWRRQVGPGGWSAHPSSAGYTEADSWLVDYPAMVRAFDKAFGEGALRVLRYEKELERNGTVIPAIVGALGLDETISRRGSEATWMNPTKPKPLAALPSSRSALEAECSHLHRRLGLLSRERDGLEVQLGLEKEQARRLEDVVAGLERELLEARRDLEEFNLEAERSALTVASMNSSASWRLTRPARAAKRVSLQALSACNSRGRIACRAAGLAGLTTGVAALLLLA